MRMTYARINSLGLGLSLIAVGSTIVVVIISKDTVTRIVMHVLKKSKKQA